MNNLILSALSSPKSTAFGFGAAVLNLLAQGVNWKSALLSVTLAGFGAVAQDHKAGN